MKANQPDQQSGTSDRIRAAVLGVDPRNHVWSHARDGMCGDDLLACTEHHDSIVVGWIVHVKN